MNKRKPGGIVGKELRPAASIWEDFGEAVATEIRAMARATLKEMRAAFSETTFHGAAQDASPVSQARIRLSQLSDTWQKRFNELAKKAVARMIHRIEKNAQVTLATSLQEVAKHIEIDTRQSDARLQEIISASTQEAAQLIKRIPEQYLTAVQGAVMRSITTGNGMADLVPFLEEKYQGDIKWARHVAMDQTRKAYASISQHKLRKLGCESYIWVHSGGSRYPRKDHEEMDGNQYRWDDPPIIDERTGERGTPGQAIFCRCIAKPVFSFEEGDDADD